MFQKGEIFRRKEDFSIYKVLACHDSENFVMCRSYQTNNHQKFELYKINYEEIEMNKEQKRRYKKLQIKRRSEKIDKLIK